MTGPEASGRSTLWGVEVWNPDKGGQALFSIAHRREPEPVFDRRGYYRSPVTAAGYRRGHPAPNKGRRFPAEPLTPREVLAIINQCGRGSAGLRDRALIVLLWRTGLRCAEALSLYPKDVELEECRVHVLHGKGNKARTVGIDSLATSVIREWMAQRRKLGLTGRHPLFCVISTPTLGAPMHAAFIRNKLKILGERAGIEKRVHPHGFRHTHAFELAGEGVDLRLIQHSGSTVAGPGRRAIANCTPLSPGDLAGAGVSPSA